VAQALLDHNEDRGRLPPAATYGPDGQPLLSWRVLVLPYLGERGLYDQFHLDEPWDSPHNLTLLSRMPAVYGPPRWKSKKVPAHHTLCQVFTGERTVFRGRESLRVPRDIPDGTGNTILIVEAGKPVPWTKPEDIPYDPHGPLPDLTGLFEDGVRVCMVDGELRFVTKETREELIRRAIVPDDGDFGFDW
jgi:hypothetical protein